MKDQNQFSEFLRLLAHDLQNQIGAVDLNLQIMPTLVDESDLTLHTLQPFITRASNSASEMIETLSDLQVYAYSLSREAHESKAPTESESFDLVRKLKDCALAVASRARFRDVEVKVIHSSPVFVSADGEAVSRALKLIVADSLRSSFPGGSIELRVSAPADQDRPRPFIEISASQEGLFELSRLTLALFLAQEGLKSSGVDLVFAAGESSSSLRLVFPAATRRT